MLLNICLIYLLNYFNNTMFFQQTKKNQESNPKPQNFRITIFQESPLSSLNTYAKFHTIFFNKSGIHSSICTGQRLVSPRAADDRNMIYDRTHSCIYIRKCDRCNYGLVLATGAQLTRWESDNHSLLIYFKVSLGFNLVGV